MVIGETTKVLSLAKPCATLIKENIKKVETSLKKVNINSDNIKLGC